jgi:hypothetical protein
MDRVVGELEDLSGRDVQRLYIGPFGGVRRIPDGVGARLVCEPRGLPGTGQDTRIFLDHPPGMVQRRLFDLVKPAAPPHERLDDRITLDDRHRPRSVRSRRRQG